MLQVSNDFKSVVALIFSTGWRILTSFDIPGTNINVVEFAIASLVLLFVIRRVLPIIGVKELDADGNTVSDSRNITVDRRGK